MKLSVDISIKKRSYHIWFCFFFLLLFGTQPIAFTQINFVPNHSFETLIDCDLNFGDVPKAEPWNIVDFPATTPDIFHYCSTSGFYVPPAGVQLMDPKVGEGMLGQVNLIAEERVYVRLIETLPEGVDIYVAFSTVPMQKSGGDSEILCYSNTESMAFSDLFFQNKKVVLESDTIIDNTVEWTTLQTCYQATGTEELVLLGNYKLGSETLTDCENIDPNNYAYFLVDEVIVSPFDVVPDTAFLCGDEVLNMNITFYEVPIQWEDEIFGGDRLIETEGEYIVMGDIGNCFLRDTMTVIVIPDETESIHIALCENESVILETPVLSDWGDGNTSMFYQVNEPGIYSANMFSECGESIREFVVEEISCSIQYFVPNIFTPNDDGINDQLEFFFKADFEFNGTLDVFDRWGNLVFNGNYNSLSTNLKWDGSFKGDPLNSAVFVWAFHYTSSANGRTQVIYGDFTLVR